MGPFFQFFPGVIGDTQPFLWTDASDDSILLGVLRTFNESARSTFNVTISLTDGSIQTGWPENASRTAPPAKLADPSGGAETIVSADGSSMNLVVEGDIVYSLELELPGNYAGVQTNRIFYFIDEEIAYVFYAGELDCSSNVGVAECENCPDCTLTENYFSAALDLRTAETIATGVPFQSSYGLNVHNPGPMNSVSTVYNEIQVANVGELDSCGGSGYLLYNANGTVQALARFDPGNLYATVGDYEAYAIHQEERFGETTRYVENFEIRKFSMISGETLSTIQLDTDALWSLSGLEKPMEKIAEPTPAPLSPTGPIVPITFRLPTPAPVIAPIPNNSAVTVAPISVATAGPVAPISMPPMTSNPVATTLQPVATLQPVGAVPFVEVNGTTTASPTAVPINNATQSPTEAVLGDSSATTQFPQCSSNQACAELALDGDCCPTTQSVMLQCCDLGGIELNCPANPRCAAEDLDGACCPTSEGAFLDCCEVVPDDCGSATTDCVILRVADYKAMRSSAASWASVVLAAICCAFLVLKL